MIGTPFTDRLAAFAERVAARIPDLRRRNEEATKNALVLPFLKELGYDPFDPAEVDPEFTADVGIKKGERVDYAVLRGDAVVLLVECKKVGTKLADAHRGQLLRYFHVTDSARFALLTDGLDYRFFTDLDASNRMDPEPFLRVDLRDLDREAVAAAGMFEKAAFDPVVARSAAAAYRTRLALRGAVAEELEEPSSELIRLFRGRVGGAGSIADLEFSRLLREAIGSVGPSRGGEAAGCSGFPEGSLAGAGVARRKSGGVGKKRDQPGPTESPPVEPKGVEVDGRFLPAANVPEALVKFFRAMNARDPEFLQRFAESNKDNKGRTYLADRPAKLFPKSPHLAEKHATEVLPGWWIDTNQGYLSAARIMKLAAGVAGLEFGKGVKTFFPA